ncbi:MAG TPA: hypothetical protein VFV50_14125 [Bdellovibrionales bacterium]|nr:hypothetical protein [Bdellovibrionales bacterium]
MKDLFPLNRLARATGLALLSIIFLNCSPVAFSVTDRSGSNIEPVDPVDPTESCYTDQFRQPTQAVGKLDILFVTDTSGSLDTERAAVANGIDAFVAGLNNNVDYNIAVMLGHGSTSSYAGKLYQHAAEPVVLTKAQGLAQIRADLRTKLSSPRGDGNSDGGEMNLYSVNRAVTDAALFAGSQAQGFFRNDAALAVVFVGDENDICAEYPAGVTPVPDPQGSEPVAKARDCGGITPLSVYNNLKAKKGMKPTLVSSIIYLPGQAYPMTDENEIGYGMLEATELSKGLKVNLAGTETQIANGLFDIGKLADSQLPLITKHTLSKPGTLTALEVRIDNQVETDFTFEAATREVHLNRPGSAGSSVAIRYCVK